MPDDQPRCLFLAAIDLAAATDAEVDGPVGLLPAEEQIRYFIDVLIDGLAANGMDGGLPYEFDIAAFGYRRNGEKVEVASLLPEVPLSTEIEPGSQIDLDTPAE